MEPFLPPRFNLALHWTADAALPLFLRTALNILSVEISDEDKALARRLREQNLIVYLNHPTTAEPAVAYSLANTMGVRFHYIASREVFDWLGGMMGYLLQGLGAFSMMPGTEDRDSIRMARSILGRPGGQLVVFPEGEPPTGENDRLRPFLRDAMHLAFRGHKDLDRSDTEMELMVLPAFVRYVLEGSRQDILRDVHASLSRLESRPGLIVNADDVSAPGGSLFERIVRLHRNILRLGEEEFGLTAEVAGGRSLRLQHAILDDLADRHAMADYPRDQSPVEKHRFIRSIIERRQVNFPDPRLPEMNREQINDALVRCGRAASLIALGEEAVDPSIASVAETVIERIQRMEEYFSNGGGRPRPCRALIRLGEPIRVKEFMSTYERSKKVGLGEFTEQVRLRLSSLLEETRSRCTKLEE